MPNAMLRKFPYLLRGVKVTHVNQVWSTDITYIRLKHGFVYLTVVIDWYSRRMLASRLLNSLSMDGKGRSLDNVYIERFWRTLKYEDIYLKGYTDMKACYRGIKAFIDRYNDRRRHSSLDNHTPSEVYFNHVVLKSAA